MAAPSNPFANLPLEKLGWLIVGPLTLVEMHVVQEYTDAGGFVYRDKDDYYFYYDGQTDALIQLGEQQIVILQGKSVLCVALFDKPDTAVKIG